MFVFNWFLIQLKVLKNSFQKDRKDFLFKDLWHLLILLVGLALIYFFLYSMFNFLAKKGFSPFDFAFTLSSFSLLIFLPLIFYSAIVCSLSFLFQKEEVHFYFSLPVSRISIFTVKFIQVYFHTTWMAFLGFAAFLAAVQSYFKLSPLIYITGGINFLVYLLIPVALAVIIVIIVSRFLSFVQAKDILTVMGLFVGSVLIAAIRVMQPEQLVTADGKMRLATFIQQLHKPWMTFLPSEWVTNGLFSHAQRDIAGIAINFLSLLTMATALILLVYLLARLFYAKIWADAALMPLVVNKNFGWQKILKIFPESTRGLIKKDLLNLYRDNVERGSLFILIPLSFVYLYSMYMLNRHIRNAGEEEVFSFLYLYLFNFFYSAVIISGLSGRWVFPSISLEGNNFKLIKSSPLSLEDFLKAKFFLGFTPLLFLGQALIIVSSLILHWPPAFILLSMLTMALLCYGITSLCLILGMRQADFSIREPLDFALSYRGFLCLVWELIFTSAVIVLVGIPTFLFLSHGFSRPFFISFSASLTVTLVILASLQRVYKSSIARLYENQISGA